MGVEPTGDRIACRPPVLKTGTITGPHALPWNCGEKAMDDEVTGRSPLQRSADRAIHGCSFRRLETTGLKPRGIWPLKEAYRAALPRPIIWSVVRQHSSTCTVPRRSFTTLFRSTVPRHSCKALFHTACLLRLRNDAQVGLGGLPSAGILFLGFFVRNVAADDDVIARLPVRWRGNFVLCRELN